MFNGAALNDNPSYELASKKVQVDELFSVDVLINNNPGIISLRFKIAFDSEFVELIEVENKASLNGFTTPSPTTSSPYTLRWADAFAEENNSFNGSVVSLKFKALKKISETAI